MNGTPISSAIRASLGPIVGRSVRCVAHRGAQTGEEVARWVRWRLLALREICDAESVFPREGGVARVSIDGISEGARKLDEGLGSTDSAEGGIYREPVRTGHGSRRVKKFQDRKSVV